MRAESGKAIIFLANANFLGQKRAAKNEKSVSIKRKNGIHSIQRDKLPKIPKDFLLIINGWGESGKAILQVSIAVVELRNCCGRCVYFCTSVFAAAAFQMLIDNDNDNPLMIFVTQQEGHPACKKYCQGFLNTIIFSDRLNLEWVLKNVLVNFSTSYLCVCVFLMMVLLVVCLVWRQSGEHTWTD